MPKLGEAEDMPLAPLRRVFDTVQSSGEGFMAERLNLYSGLGAEEEYRAHLGHEQLTAFVLTLREVRYKEEQTPFSWPLYPK